MIIQNGLVYQEDKTFARKNLYIEDGIIVDAPSSMNNQEIVDAEGLLVLPGLIDIHSHGACGHDFSDGDAKGLARILEYQYAHGITSYCPTSMTLAKDSLPDIFSVVEKLPHQRGMAHIAGINMEGPFLDPDKKGAHKEEYIIEPDIDFFRQCQASCGNQIRLVTLAPNMPGSLAFIKALKEDTTISLGHTSADYDTAKAAIDAGATQLTHLFNAMMPLSHREPGMIGAAAEADRCMAELICDGVHIHESMVRAAFKLFPDRIILISDSMRAAGMEDGTYDLGGQQVTVSGRRAVLSDGTIAGSATNLFDCMRTAVSFGIPMEEAIAAATMHPAKSIGIYDHTGSLTPGKRADIILTDGALNLKKVI